MATIHKTKILLRNDTLANWKKSTLPLEKGEVAFAYDTADYRVGIGGANSVWSKLPAPKVAVVLNRAPISSDTDYQPGQLWVDTSDNGRLYVMDVLSNWKSFTFYEEYEQCMLTEEYVGDTAIKAVKMADTLKANGKYVEVDDNTSKGLWSASNTEKKIKTAADAAVQEACVTIRKEKGIANGFASLDEDGKVLSAQLPSYVDDVVEVATYASLPTTGEAGKIYVITEKAPNASSGVDSQYRWSGSKYVQITSGNIVVADGSGSAYPNASGIENRNVLDAVAYAINKTSFDTFSETYDNYTYNDKSICARLDIIDELLTNFYETGIKGCVKIDKNNPVNLIVTNDLYDLCVTDKKLANDAVTTAKIKDGNVTAAKLAADAVTSACIADKSITRDKLDVTLQSQLGDASDPTSILSDNCIVTGMIKDEAVTNAKIASVTWDKLTLESGDTLIFDCGNATA